MKSSSGRIAVRLATVAMIASSAFATGISYTCDASINSSLCTTLNTTTAGQYATVFSNANSLIYIQMASTGGVASNLQFYNTVTYAQYYNALSSHESGAADVTAVGSLPGSGNPLLNGDGVALTSSLAQALGLSGGIGIDKSGNSCTLGTGSCYNDVITVSNSQPFYYGTGSYTSGEYDFFTAVEHETDESLGTSSCIGNTTGTPVLSAGCDNFTFGTSAADLFRYSANGTRSYLGSGGNQAEGSLAYFSINHGATNIVPYNNTNNGADYGDFSTNCQYVQDAYGCTSGSGVTILNDGGVEIAVLDAVGYNLTTAGKGLSATGTGAPEPGTMGTIAGWLGILWVARKRRARG